jgi:microcystin-dependent protein
MGQPYVGEIRMFAGTFAPVGWMFCDGQMLPISENEVLFQAIGTTYGGDGESTFALPDLRGRIPIHAGSTAFASNYQVGDFGGDETVTLLVTQIPAHEHPYATLASAANTSPVGNLVADTGISAIYADANQVDESVASPSAMGGGGESQPHDNVMPFLCVNFIISLFGLWPNQT